MAESGFAEDVQRYADRWAWVRADELSARTHDCSCGRGDLKSLVDDIVSAVTKDDARILRTNE